MSTNTALPIDIYLENPDTEDLDDLLDEVLTEVFADEDFSDDLIDLINQNFVMEVEASHGFDVGYSNRRSVSGEIQEEM